MTDGARPAERPPTVFLVGYYGVGNLGDEQIRMAIEAEAGRTGARIARWATRNPLERDPRAVRLSLRGFPRYCAACWRADRVVLGGGGILKDEGLRLPAELLLTVLLARIARRPVALLAVGVGPFYSRVGTWFIRGIACLAEVRTVRDEASADALTALGVLDVEVGADPIFSLPAPSLDPAARGAAMQHEGRTALVSIRPWFHKAADGAARWETFTGQVAAALDLLAAEGWWIRFAGLYWPRDHDAARAVAARMRFSERAVVDDTPVTWADLGGAAASADLVIAMRYHALAAAIIGGRPCLALAYEPKVAELARFARVGCVPVEVPDVGDRLAGLVREAMRDPSRAEADAAALGVLRERARRILRLALRGIE